MTDAFEHHWPTLEDTVRGYLHRRLGGDMATVDDLSQEVVLRMRRGLRDIRSADAIGPWTMRIARAVLVDHLRRQRPVVGMEALAASPAETEDHAELAALAAFVRGEVAKLPIHEAKAVGLADLDGETPARTAQLLGITMPALKARLHRGRRRLREAVDRCCDIGRDGRGQPSGCTPRGSGCAGCRDL